MTAYENKNEKLSAMVGVIVSDNKACFLFDGTEKAVAEVYVQVSEYKDMPPQATLRIKVRTSTGNGNSDFIIGRL